MGEQQQWGAGDEGRRGTHAGKKGNWTHEPRAAREGMILRGFKRERANITITTRRTVCVCVWH